MHEDLLTEIRNSFDVYDYETEHEIPDETHVTLIDITYLDDLTIEEQAKAVENHKNDTPLTLMRCGYSRSGFAFPIEKYKRDPETNFWICNLHDGKDVYEGVSRDRKTAAHIAASYLLDDAINADRGDKFFLPKDKNEALNHVAIKRAALIKFAEECKIQNPFKYINEYAQFNKVPIKVDETTTGPPFTSTILFNGKTYSMEGPSKKEARKNAATIIYDELVESNKYFEYKAAQEKATALKKIETQKYRVKKDDPILKNEKNENPEKSDTVKSVLTELKTLELNEKVQIKS